MHWIRFLHDGGSGFGSLADGVVTPHEGDLFGLHSPAGDGIASDAVELLAPVAPGKIIGLANNFHALIEKMGGSVPAEPLYFIKANTSLNGPGRPIRRPRGYDGKIIFEGELGLVIGRTCRNAEPPEALDALFGCTCVNDVTAIGLLKKDPSFPQWTRSKAADTFGVLGPAVATGLEPSALRVRTEVNGQERQNYPVTDMVFSPADLISRLSFDLTLEPGDVIACGTSVGVGSLQDGDIVTVSIEGVGELTNTYEDSAPA